MTPEEKAAADKVVADKKEADVRNAQPLVIEGDAKLGGPFTITGEGFGTHGTLFVGDREIKTTRWTDTSIKGTIPAGISGDVVLTTASGVRRGKWPYVRPVVTKTTTVTVETK